VAARAVVFDLWNTLARWPEDLSRDFRERWSQQIGRSLEEIDGAWYGPGGWKQRETGPIATALRTVHESLGAETDIDELVSWRVELARKAVVPDEGVVQTLSELRRRGVRLGLISNCTEEVALVWESSQFAGHFDVEVFSATAGCMKPDPLIYELALRKLGVPASEALFVGDGANDELAGATRAGLTAVLIHPEGEDPPWEGLAGWAGLRITAIQQVLELVS
jgi:HAD superfamily hydrolase (TIGR01509 family)